MGRKRKINPEHVKLYREGKIDKVDNKAIREYKEHEEQKKKVIAVNRAVIYSSPYFVI